MLLANKEDEDLLPPPQSGMESPNNSMTMDFPQNSQMQQSYASTQMSRLQSLEQKREQIAVMAEE